MHVVDTMRTCALVKVIDVLGTEIKPVAELLFDLRERNVGSIRLRSKSIATAHGVEVPDECRIGVPRFRRRDFIDAIAVPKTSRSTESSKSTLGRDPGASEDEEAIM